MAKYNLIVNLIIKKAKLIALMKLALFFERINRTSKSGFMYHKAELLETELLSIKTDIRRLQC